VTTDHVPSLPERRHTIRVGALTHADRLRVECGSCSHRGIVLAAYLRRRINPHVRIVAIEHRLRCANCGERGGSRWDIEQVRKDRR
jgi:DNA-directed RNA polymerase subunit RPC12/RpoP